MTNVLRRTVLFSAATGADSVLFSTKASAVEKQYDPDIFAIEARMMRFSNRGSSLTESEKYGVLLATCSAQGLRDEAAEITAEALIAGVKPLVLRESVYQTAPYVGLGRMKEALTGVNEAFRKAKVPLPLPSQTTVDDENRLTKGIEVQTALFGDNIAKMHREATGSTRALIVDDLSSFCFGDFFTRSGMSVKERELIVFAAVAALGGCESQLRGHGVANLKQGTSKQNLIDALQVCVPLNGFPRTLNALSVLDLNN